MAIYLRRSEQQVGHPPRRFHWRLVATLWQFPQVKTFRFHQDEIQTSTKKPMTTAPQPRNPLIVLCRVATWSRTDGARRYPGDMPGV